MNFFIEFKSDTEELTLEFETYNTSIAIKWANELTEQLIRNSNLRENDRLYQFVDSTDDLISTITELKNKAKSINDYSFYIPDIINFDITQEILNTLHKCFEEMRGSILSPGEYYLSAPTDVRRAIEDYNVLIHKTEDILNAVKNHTSSPRMVLTFNERQRHELEDDDYNYFNLDTNFGEVYINYCEVGKTLWDVFRDADGIIGDHNIRPLKWYSADMKICFFNNSHKSKINKFWQWFDENSSFLNKLGFIKHDKKLSLGNIPVAHIITDKPKSEIISNISKFKKINRVYI